MGIGWAESDDGKEDKDQSIWSECQWNRTHRVVGWPSLCRPRRTGPDQYELLYSVLRERE